MHYDTDGACLLSRRASWCSVLTRVPVLTKVVIYIGISTIATVIVLAMFEAIGWGA